MGELSITNQIADYILSEKISTNRIAKDTKISALKLRADAKERLNATELLELCSYLNVRPEAFVSPKQNNT